MNDSPKLLWIAKKYGPLLIPVLLPIVGLFFSGVHYILWIVSALSLLIVVILSILESYYRKIFNGLYIIKCKRNGREEIHSLYVQNILSGTTIIYQRRYINSNSAVKLDTKVNIDSSKYNIVLRIERKDSDNANHAILFMEDGNTNVLIEFERKKRKKMHLSVTLHFLNARKKKICQHIPKAQVHYVPIFSTNSTPEEIIEEEINLICRKPQSSSSSPTETTNVTHIEK